MADLSLELHVALLAALKAAVDCDVWDAVPQDSPYPYVVIDNKISTDLEFLDLATEEHFVYLSIWSRVAGQAEVMKYIKQISTLNGVVLDLPSGCATALRIVRKQTVRESDNLTFMGQVTLRIITQP